MLTFAVVLAAPVQLAKRCVLFALEHYDDLTSALSVPDYYTLMARMVPHLQTSLVEDAGKAADSGSLGAETPGAS